MKSMLPAARLWPVLVLALLGACAGAPSAAPAAGQGVAPRLMPIDRALLQQQQARRAQRRDADADSLLDLPAPVYTLGPGDVLSILVWDHPELSNGAPAPALAQAEPVAPANGAASGGVVDQEGLLRFPYAGAVRVAGLSPAQAAQALAAALARYLHEPRVSLQVQAYRSQRVYVDGEVKTPGALAITDIAMTLPEALHRAGGMLPTADQSRLRLERGGRSYRIDLRQMAQNKRDPSALVLRHGDLLHLLARDESKVFVSGEVVNPRALPMHDGRMSLNEALGESGGLHPLTSERSQVYVVRRGPDGPEVFQLDASVPGALAIAEEFELEPKDVVYVAPSGLANWHRNISLIFPSALSSAVSAGKP